ncbi:transcription factor bHLH118-like [Chenopodium quinoa]|uniref:transcription factor bHLH118-like n=1 Tax=Chenopodium quinoa TaxID=63459 RepID=UPI000B76D438|nr:transcription factor bHLH118-like [Chenopodium quinoa]
MFPFQRSCELSFKISDEGDQIEEEDQIMLNDNNVSVGLNYTTSTNPGRGRGRGGRGRRSSSLLASSSNNTNTANNDDDERKVMHREYERQRRQEMADLYNSLRLTLPSESTQGKKSTSDHIGEAVNYIQHLKKNVKELEERRDQLKQSVDQQESTSSTSELGGSSNSSVTIRQSVVGFEIEIRVGCEDEDRFSLSSAIQVIFDEGLEVVSCTSTKFNDRLIHHLQCQVGNTACIDVNQLQQKLNNLVC